MENSEFLPVCMDRVIQLDGEIYKLSLWPETFKEEDGHEFTGNYDGILEDVNGTKTGFSASPFYTENNSDLKTWELFPETNQALIPIIADLIAEYRKDD